MKVVNIALQAPYNEGWGYHENLLPKWQRKNGNDVTLITTRFTNKKNDDGLEIVDVEEYINSNGVKIIRLDWLANIFLFRILRLYKNTYKTIELENPDFIFIHGCQFLDIFAIRRYLKKHPTVKASIDNHSDETNSAMTLPAKLLHRICWNITANSIKNYVYKFYGVLPARCDFLKKYYGISEDKIDLLVMGADDDVVNAARDNINSVKKKYDIDPNYFNIVCGGKFDHYKTEVLELMKSVNRLDNVHLYIYGSIGDEIKDAFDTLISNKITYVGWLNQVDSYALLLNANIGVFPGRHSVIWEQCVGLGIPLIVKDLPGTHHIDLQNNCIFLKTCKEEEIYNILYNVISNETSYIEMKNASMSNKNRDFLYSEIAKKSINY